MIHIQDCLIHIAFEIDDGRGLSSCCIDVVATDRGFHIVRGVLSAAKTPRR